MSDRSPSLDPRAWLLWAAATTFPALAGRNPFPLLTILIAVLLVRAAWSPLATNAHSATWRTFLRLALLFAVISILFNTLTSHYGDLEFAHLPASWPIIGGPLTINALFYGALSAIALLLIVLVGATMGITLDWPSLLRLLPDRLLPLAVAGSIAWAFVPQTAAAFRTIRESQLARGYRFRGPRDLPPLIIPLLAGGLDRAVTMAETLESRGLGATTGASNRPVTFPGLLMAFALTSAVVGCYLLAVGHLISALVAALLALGATVVLLTRRAAPAAHRTRFREPRWRTADSLVLITAAIALGIELVTYSRNPAALRYEPFPGLEWPRVDLLLLAGCGLLLTPLFVIPSRSEHRSP